MRLRYQPIGGREAALFSPLRPIDPQVIRSDGNGNRMAHSVLSYLEAFEHHAEVLKQDPGKRRLADRAE
jgi:hypothetical protein